MYTRQQNHDALALLCTTTASEAGLGDPWVRGDKDFRLSGRENGADVGIRARACTMAPWHQESYAIAIG